MYHVIEVGHIWTYIFGRGDGSGEDHTLNFWDKCVHEITTSIYLLLSCPSNHTGQKGF